MDESRPDHVEDLRQLEHLLPIGFAFLLPFIGFSTILVLAIFAFFYALFISPRLFPSTTRADERLKGFSPGKLSYAAAVLALILIFHDALHIAAATWGILAAGDSVSNVIGRRFGHHELPYNEEKTIIGLLSFGITGTLAAWTLLIWNLEGAPFSLPNLLLFAAIAAFLCAFFESLPSPIDDNIAICWVGGTVFALLFTLESYLLVEGSWLEALMVNAAIAAISFRKAWLSEIGTMLSFLMGFIVYTSLGFPAYLSLLLFLVLSSLATSAGSEQKEARRIAQPEKGRRGAINVISNGLVPFGLAIFGFWTNQEFLVAAFLSGVATATVDTVSTEIGQWLGKRPIQLRTFQASSPGTPGAVSIEGTLAGLGAGAVVVGAAVIGDELPPVILAVALTSAFIASMAESIVGSYAPRDLPLSDEVLNLYNTFLGAFLGGITWLLL